MKFQNHRIHPYKPIKTVKIMDEITIEELKNNNSKRVSILIYRGEGDPVNHLDDKIREYTNGEQYWEFIDVNMDNPWTRIIVFGKL